VQDLVRAEPGFTTPELLWEVNQLSVSQPIYLSFYPSIHIYLSNYACTCFLGAVHKLTVSLAIYLPMHIHLHLPTHIHIHLPMHLPIHIHILILLSCS